MTNENQIEQSLIAKLTDLKYTYREDIRDRATLELNFRNKFQELNRVSLSDTEFSRLKEMIISSDVFTSSQLLRNRNTFERDDGTPLLYTLVNVRDWCKNTFAVVNQLRINTENSHQRCDVILLINGVPVVQIELKTLAISPRRAIEILAISDKHDLKEAALKSFVDGIIGRMIFDGEQLTDLLTPLELNWKARRKKELSLMADLTPVLNRLAQGKEISGLSAYEE